MREEGGAGWLRRGGEMETLLPVPEPVAG